MAEEKDKVAAVETGKNKDALFQTEKATVTKESGSSASANATTKEAAIEKAAKKA